MGHDRHHVHPERNRRVKIAVVGDVHNQWEADDALALHNLGVDLVLFVGDFGNEAVEVVAEIANLDLPYAAILGNHDAWYSATDWGLKRSPYNREEEDWVQQQLDLLGDRHVGYTYLDFPALNLTVVGGRPFSWGGSTWKCPDFYQKRFGVKSFAESTEKIVAAALASKYSNVIFIGHNGPLGLGSEPESPCGKDWEPIGEDFGDPDLAEAIEKTMMAGKKVPLVTFGHMHHQLRQSSAMLRDDTRPIERTALVNGATGTIYLNAASVPRIIKMDGSRLHNFSLVELEAGIVTAASLIWVDRQGKIAHQRQLYQSALSISQ
ncbi:TIGR04168 family protein [Merismopedia glauca]|uniref:TIGR04168 family protein n=1 Tax=Merismopedia glauca CCAP 1448/3 TaxID=1296344 RepID=A0A2T1C4S3_9CYAN|nr:TIGR04168 family protein [Merismopedia glauca]PSB03256.1 TIGR04168 family protein [Merismopedia glauca CCAP 1448/3]